MFNCKKAEASLIGSDYVDSAATAKTFISNLSEARAIAAKYWNPGMATGVWLVDTHHQILFALVQKLALVEPANDNAFTIGTVLHDLSAYARFHFRREEELFTSHGLLHENHANEHGHEQFIEDIDGYLQKLHTKPYSPALRFEILGFLNTWWSHHILGTDLDCSKKLLKKDPSVAQKPANAIDTDVHIAFDVFDENGDNAIDATELRNVLFYLGKKVTEAEVSAILKQVTGNAGGRITFDQFKAATGIGKL